MCIRDSTWSADAALTDMNGQMAGATQMNTDLANGESKIWILDDPEGKLNENIFVLPEICLNTKKAVVVPKELYYYVQRGSSIMKDVYKRQGHT